MADQPIPPGLLPSSAAAPVASVEDVRKAWPHEMLEAEQAPVRDALIEAQLAMFFAYQEASSHAAAQSDPTRATGKYLEEFTGEVDIHRQLGEDDETLRDRYFAVPDLVSPNAIKRVVDRLLAPHTDKRCQLFESIGDRMFLGDGAAPWCRCFLGDGDTEIEPGYPARRYALRKTSSPGGPRPFADHYGRLFVVRVPLLEGATAEAAFLFDGVQASARPFALGDGADPNGSRAFLFAGATLAMKVYARIAAQLDRITGQGIRWILEVDPKL
jgi:hypothetical protein